MKCMICKKKLDVRKDYWKLCRKCQPAWLKGRQYEV